MNVFGNRMHRKREDNEWTGWEIYGQYLLSLSLFLYVFQFVSKNLEIKMYRSIILPVVLYGWETWSLTLREERRLRVFESRVLRGILGPKMDEVTGER